MKHVTTSSPKEQMSAELINLQSGDGGIPPTSKQLVEYEELPDSPFTVVIRDGQWALALGRFIITEYRPWQEPEGGMNNEEVWQYIEDNRWHIIVNLTLVAVQATDNVKEESLRKMQQSL